MEIGRFSAADRDFPIAWATLKTPRNASISGDTDVKRSVKPGREDGAEKALESNDFFSLAGATTLFASQIET